VVYARSVPKELGHFGGEKGYTQEPCQRFPYEDEREGTMAWVVGGVGRGWIRTVRCVEVRKNHAKGLGRVGVGKRAVYANTVPKIHKCVGNFPHENGVKQRLLGMG